MQPKQVVYFMEIGCQRQLTDTLISCTLYPNVCHYRDKRRVYTLEQATALMSKQSVNTRFHSSDIIKFPSSLFVFSGKGSLRTEVISCKQISNITPLQLLLFGSQKVDIMFIHPFFLFFRIPLQMNVQAAARIVAFCLNPEATNKVDENDNKLLKILKQLSSLFGWSPNEKLLEHSSKRMLALKEFLARATLEGLLN
uniref:Uncharacterized protein n=1 Tax=Wuchereria bancrofti TaxID=6293 RepID=A0A1I8EU44_WUCBA